MRGALGKILRLSAPLRTSASQHRMSRCIRILVDDLIDDFLRGPYAERCAIDASAQGVLAHCQPQNLHQISDAVFTSPIFNASAAVNRQKRRKGFPPSLGSARPRSSKASHVTDRDRPRQAGRHGILNWAASSFAVMHRPAKSLRSMRQKPRHGNHGFSSESMRRWTRSPSRLACGPRNRRLLLSEGDSGRCRTQMPWVPRPMIDQPERHRRASNVQNIEHRQSHLIESALVALGSVE